MMAAAKGKTNWFAIWISIAAVVVVVGVAVVVVWANNAASGPGTTPQSSNINTDTGAIAVGTGEGTLDTYVDFMCPICGTFESTYGSAIEGLVDDGTITLNIHPISILDARSSGTNYSTRAANAMYVVAAAHPDLALPYLQALFKNQPKESSSGLTDDELISIAGEVGANDVADGITKGTYKKFVSYVTAKTPLQPGQTGIATPTIAVNGEVMSNKTFLTGDPQADIVSRFKN